jgi:hypothetical protein
LTIVRKQRRLKQGQTGKGNEASWQSLLGLRDGVVEALDEVHASPEQLVIGNVLSCPSPQYLVHRVSFVTPEFPVFEVRVMDRVRKGENPFVGYIERKTQRLEGAVVALMSEADAMEHIERNRTRMSGGITIEDELRLCIDKARDKPCG